MPAFFRGRTRRSDQERERASEIADPAASVPAGRGHLLDRAARRAIHFRRRQDGSVAVEFALISVPFCALLFAIIETSLVFWSGQVLETAVHNASRKVFTGEFAKDMAGVPAGQHAQKFKDLVCAGVPGLFDCPTLVSVDVRAFTDFQSVAGLPPIVKDGAINNGEFGFNPGGPAQTVIVRAAMPYKMLTGFLGSGMENLAGGKHLIMATAAFRTEPYN